MLSEENKKKIIDLINEDDCGYGEIVFKINDSKVVLIQERIDTKV